MQINRLLIFALTKEHFSGCILVAYFVARLLCLETYYRAANDAVRLHGGYGLMKDDAVERHYRNQKLLDIGSPEDSHRQEHGCTRQIHAGLR
jgi:alkylation response protein AidB-like acyl-CoA dehydrogenase